MSSPTLASPVPHPIQPHRSAPRATLGVLLTLALIAGLLLALQAAPARAASVGSGSYAETPPAGAELPQGCGDLTTNPRGQLTANAPKGPVPTNDWWSSILFKKTNCAFGEPLFAHPAAYKAAAGGLGISYETKPVISGSAGGVGEYKFPYTQDVLVGIAGLNAGSVLVDGWSDWTVTPSWTDGSRTLTATIGHGLPMSYYTAKGGSAQLTTNSSPRVWSSSGSRLGFTVDGHDYVAYAPSGASWAVSGSTITSTLGGKSYFTVAVLPTTTSSSDSDRTALADAYGPYAHAHVTGTKIDYGYDAASAKVSSTYTFTTKAMEGTQTKTVTALYPHQWKALAGGSPISQTYVSPRGAMKALVGVSSFSTAMTFHGILPELPAVATGSGADQATLVQYLNQVAGDPSGQQPTDTYWTGKGLGRAARVAEISDQVGQTATRDKALSQIKSTLTDWFTASPGKAEKLFYYDKNWGTLIGYPASYGSAAELNDHHFHYGYYIAAAATLARFDPSWAKNSAYGGMVDLLIRDANNYDRSDTRFPYLRDFDIYAGHDWASGHGSFGSGNNQESSSEGMNFAGALIQWGEVTGNTAVRDAGIFIYTTQAAAIENYWFDVDGNVFPTEFPHSTVGMVWGDGGAYSTWFTADPEKIQGINQLPVTGSHLYLGWNPSYNKINYAEVEKNRGGPPTAWQDILWEFLALGDGDAALAKFKANPDFTSEEGETKAHTWHWIRNLAALGNVDTTVNADQPLAAVFTKSGKKTYVAANVTSVSRTVTFSDGTKLTVPAGKTATTGAQTWSGGAAPGGSTKEPSASPTPTPTATPSSTPTATPSSTSTPTVSPTGTPTGNPVSGFTVRLGADGKLDAAPNRSQQTLTAANGENPGGTGAIVWLAKGLTGTATGGAATFDLLLDADSAVGNGTQLRISLDLTGNGSWDRTETYNYFATDSLRGYEHYTQAAKLLSSTGTIGDLVGGTVRVELWNTIGRHTSTVEIGDRSVITLPFR